jgi:hypothetical protein
VVIVFSGVRAGPLRAGPRRLADYAARFRIHADRSCREAARVLEPGGRFVFTDPMQADDASPGSLQAIHDRLHLSSLASPTFYRNELLA